MYNEVTSFESVDKILNCSHLNKSCRAVLSCGIVYYSLVKVVITSEYVDEILKCDHSVLLLMSFQLVVVYLFYLFIYLFLFLFISFFSSFFN